MDLNNLKRILKEGIKTRTYQKRFKIACDFPQDEIDLMIDEIIDELSNNNPPDTSIGKLNIPLVNF